MLYRELGTTGAQVSEIILGAWQFGQDSWTDVKDSESVAAIHAALDAGINMIDTAVGYGKGYSEQIVGNAVKDRRDKVLIASKIGAAPDGILKGIDACLERMGIDYIDLYQVHYPSPRIPIADTIGAMDEIRKAGKVRFVGVSNFSLEQMQQAVATAKIDTCQPPYNVFWRQYDADVLPFCRENGIAVIPYSPLAQGLLTGKFQDRSTIPADIRSHSKLFAEGIFEQCVQAVRDVIEPIARAQDKTLAQTAIAWMLQTPGITAPIVGARTPQQVEGNLGGVGWKLTDEEYQAISEAGTKISVQLDFSSNMWGYAPR
ncbi:aldo/keto reductase [bacterium]|nr:aldo/keto reductase [bacterium]